MVGQRSPVTRFERSCGGCNWESERAVLRASSGSAATPWRTTGNRPPRVGCRTTPRCNAAIEFAEDYGFLIAPRWPRMATPVFPSR